MFSEKDYLQEKISKIYHKKKNVHNYNNIEVFPTFSSPFTDDLEGFISNEVPKDKAKKQKDKAERLAKEYGNVISKSIPIKDTDALKKMIDINFEVKAKLIKN